MHDVRCKSCFTYGHMQAHCRAPKLKFFWPKSKESSPFFSQLLHSKSEVNDLNISPEPSPGAHSSPLRQPKPYATENATPHSPPPTSPIAFSPLTLTRMSLVALRSSRMTTLTSRGFSLFFMVDSWNRTMRTLLLPTLSQR